VFTIVTNDLLAMSIVQALWTGVSMHCDGNFGGRGKLQSVILWCSEVDPMFCSEQKVNQSKVIVGDHCRTHQQCVTFVAQRHHSHK
jgi:hypothetical protein